MKIKIVHVMWLVAVAAAAAPAAAQPAARDVEAVEQGRLASMERGDIDAVEKVLAPDFTVVGANGRTSTRAEYLARLRAATMPRPHLIHDEVQIRVYGDAAIIAGRSRSVVNGQEQRGQVRYLHVYTKENGAWRMVAMQVTAIAEPAP